MSNLSIKINLLQLKNAGIINLQGRTATKRCLVIPVDDANLYVGQKGCYLNLTAIELQNSQYGDSHCIKQNLSKEAYEALTEEQRKATPIIGNVREHQTKTQIISPADAQLTQAPGGEEDLPF